MRAEPGSRFLVICIRLTFFKFPFLLLSPSLLLLFSFLFIFKSQASIHSFQSERVSWENQRGEIQADPLPLL